MLYDFNQLYLKNWSREYKTLCKKSRFLNEFLNEWVMHMPMYTHCWMSSISKPPLLTFFCVTLRYNNNLKDFSKKSGRKLVYLKIFNRKRKFLFHWYVYSLVIFKPRREIEYVLETLRAMLTEIIIFSSNNNLWKSFHQGQRTLKQKCQYLQSPFFTVFMQKFFFCDFSKTAHRMISNLFVPE